MNEKLNDYDLISLIWEAQLKGLVEGVLHFYAGKGEPIAVCEKDQEFYRYAQFLSYGARHTITKKLSKGHLGKRIKSLQRKTSYFSGTNDMWNYYIDTPQAKLAFLYARELWLGFGVPCGYDDNGKARSKVIKGYDEAVEQFKIHMLQKFASNWLKEGETVVIKYD